MSVLSSSKSSQVLKGLCAIKSNFSKDSHVVKKLAEDGTVDRLLVHLKEKWRTEEFVNCADVALSILGNCLIEVDIRVKCVDGGIVPALVWWLEHEKSTCSLLFRASRCLTNLAGYEIDNTSDTSAKQGDGDAATRSELQADCLKAVLTHTAVAEALTKLLADHTGHRRCVFGLFKLLAVFVKYAPWCRRRFITDGKISSALVSGLSSQTLEVVKSALCCVETCTSLDLGFAKALAMADGIPVVVKLAEHTHFKTRQRALLTLVHCVWEPSCRFKFGGCQGFRVLLHHMRGSSHDSRRRAALVKAIAVCCQDVVCREKAREEGVLKVLVEMLASGQYSSLHRTILRCLLCFYFDEASLTYMCNRLPLVDVLAKRVLLHHLSRRGKPACGLEDCFYPHNPRHGHLSNAKTSTVDPPVSGDQLRGDTDESRQSPINVDQSPVPSPASASVSNSSECVLDLKSGVICAMSSTQQAECADTKVSRTTDAKSFSTCNVQAGDTVSSSESRQGGTSLPNVVPASEESQKFEVMPCDDVSFRPSPCPLAVDATDVDTCASSLFQATSSVPVSPKAKVGTSHEGELSADNSHSLPLPASAGQPTVDYPALSVCSSSTPYCLSPDGSTSAASVSLPSNELVCSDAYELVDADENAQQCQALSLASYPSPVPMPCLSPSSCGGVSPQSGSLSPEHDTVPAQCVSPTLCDGLPPFLKSSSRTFTADTNLAETPADNMEATAATSMNDPRATLFGSHEPSNALEEAYQYFLSVQGVHPAASPPREQMGRLFGAGLSKFAEPASGDQPHGSASPPDLHRSPGITLPPVSIPDGGPLTSPVPTMLLPPSTPASPQEQMDVPLAVHSHVTSTLTLSNPDFGVSPSEDSKVPSHAKGKATSRVHDKQTVSSVNHTDGVSIELCLLDRFSQLSGCVVSLCNRLVIQCLVAHLAANGGNSLKPALRTLSRLVSDTQCLESLIEQQCILVLDRLRCDSLYCSLREQCQPCRRDMPPSFARAKSSESHDGYSLCEAGRHLFAQLTEIAQSNYGRGVLERGLLLKDKAAGVVCTYRFNFPYVVRDEVLLNYLVTRYDTISFFMELLAASKLQDTSPNKEPIAGSLCLLSMCVTSAGDQDTLLASSSSSSVGVKPVDSDDDEGEDVAPDTLWKSRSERVVNSFGRCPARTYQQVYESLAHLFALKASLMTSHSISAGGYTSVKTGEPSCEAAQPGPSSPGRKRKHSPSTLADGGEGNFKRWKNVSDDLEALPEADETISSPTGLVGDHAASECVLSCCSPLRSVLLCCSVGYYHCRYDDAVSSGDTDVLLALPNGQCLPAHRSVLGRHSEAMKAMLCGDFLEGQHHAKVTLAGLSPLAVLCIVHAMYGCEFVASADRPVAGICQKPSLSSCCHHLAAAPHVGLGYSLQRSGKDRHDPPSPSRASRDSTVPDDQVNASLEDMKMSLTDASHPARCDGGSPEAGSASDFVAAERDFCVGGSAMCSSTSSDHNNALCILLQTIATSQQYLMADLVLSCSSAIAHHLCFHNVTEVLRFSHDYNLTALGDSCLQRLRSCSKREWVHILRRLSVDPGTLDIRKLWSELFLM